MLGFIPVAYGQIPGSYPSEIAYTGAATGGPFLCPHDPQYNTRGEPGMYYDTPLGGLSVPVMEYSLLDALLASFQTLAPAQRAKMQRQMARSAAKTNGMRGIPTDAELATVYGYTPVASGWVAAREGDYTSTWVPPNGWDPAGAYGPPVARSALSGSNMQIADVTIPAGATPSETQQIVDTLNAQSDRSFKLAIVTTVVIGTAALINSYRTWKQLHRDEALLQRKLDV